MHGRMWQPLTHEVLGRDFLNLSASIGDERKEAERTVSHRCARRSIMLPSTALQLPYSIPTRDLLLP